MERTLSRVHRSQIQVVPRSLTCMVQVTGRSSTVVPHTPQVAGSLSTRAVSTGVP